VGKTVTFRPEASRFDNSDLRWSEQHQARENDRQKQKLKQLARRAVKSLSDDDDDDWATPENHFLWASRSSRKRQSR